MQHFENRYSYTQTLHGLDKSFGRKNCQYRGKCYKHEIGFYDLNQSFLGGRVVPVTI